MDVNPAAATGRRLCGLKDELMKLRIKAAWDDYQRKVVPGDASTVQRWESRRAFYAGAQTLFTAIMTMLDPGEEPTDADLVKMDEIDKELREFVEAVKSGRA